MQAVRAYLAASFIGALISIVLLAAPSAALAGACDDMRASIMRMERESVKPPGYAALRQTLLYRALSCRDRAPANEYWYRADGTPTGALASQDRPDDAAYAATPEIGAACARATSPSVCALDSQVAATCRTPQPTSRTVCTMLFGEGYETSDGVSKGLNPKLPPTTITLDGRSYAADSRCTQGLLNASDPDMRDAAYARQLMSSCPDLLAAVERRTGLNATRDAAFWPALGELVIGNFPPRGAPTVTVATINANPDFRRMCAVAASHEQTCRARQSKATATGGPDAEHFGECAKLYGQVAAMCGRTESAAARPPVSTPSPAPKPAAAPPPVASAPPAAPGDGRSAPPPPQGKPTPPALQAMSPQCKAQLNALLEGADRGDNARAQAAYESLRGGNCDSGLRGLAQEGNLQFPERKAGELSSNTVRACIADPSNCGTAPSGVGGVRPGGGGGYEIGEVLDFAIGVLGLVNGVAGVYAAMPGGTFVSRGGGSNMGTINNRASGTYGQGGPTYVAPRQSPSTITGTK